MKTILTLLSFPVFLIAMAGCFGGGKTKADLEAQHIKVKNMADEVKNLSKRVTDLEGGGASSGAIDDQLQIIQDSGQSLQLEMEVLNDKFNQLSARLTTLEAQGAGGATASAPGIAAPGGMPAGSPIAAGIPSPLGGLPTPVAPGMTTLPAPGGFPAAAPLPTPVSTPTTVLPATPAPATAAAPSSALAGIPAPVASPGLPGIPAPVPTTPAVATPAAAPTAFPAAPAPLPTALPTAPDLPDSWYDNLIVQHYRSQYPGDNRTAKEITLRIGQQYELSGNLPTLYAADPKFKEKYERAKQP